MRYKLRLLFQDALPVLLGVLIALFVAQSLSAQPLDLKRIEAVADSVARERLAAGVTPGMAVAVGKDGEVIFSKGYGQADLEMGVSARAETVYHIASITKQFTAAAVMRLVEQGKLSLDDSITEYLPDFPTQGHRITVRHLLNHTSGIRDYFDLEEEDRRRFRFGLSYEEMAALFAEQPFDFKPGAQWGYSNTAYLLAGEIISRITGLPYATYVEHELLKPLGLENIMQCDPRRVVPNRAEGYKTDAAGQFVNEDEGSAWALGGGDGGLCATARDLVRWTQLLHSGQVVSPASLAQMTAPAVLADGKTRTYGLGLDLAHVHERPAVLHNGEIDGHRAYLIHYPEDGLTFAVLMNSGLGNPGNVEEVLARTALGIELEKVLDLSLAAEDMVPYEGTYTFQFGSGTQEMRVFREEEGLMVQIPGVLSRLRYQGSHVFIPAVDDELRLTFGMKQGRAEGVTLHMRGRAFEGKWKP